MKTTYLFLILFLGFASNETLNAQPETKINQFINKIDNYLRDINSSGSDVYISSRFNGKIIKVTGSFENEEKEFKQIIVSHKNGHQKDKIKVRFNSPNNSYLLLKVILINGEYYYIKNLTYSTDIDPRIIKKEELLTDRAYLITDFDSDYHKSSRQYSWILKEE